MIADNVKGEWYLHFEQHIKQNKNTQKKLKLWKLGCDDKIKKGGGKNFPPWVYSLDGAGGVNSACERLKTIILLVLKGIPEWESFFDFGQSANCFIFYK